MFEAFTFVHDADAFNVASRLGAARADEVTPLRQFERVAAMIARLETPNVVSIWKPSQNLALAWAGQSVRRMGFVTTILSVS